MTEEKRSVHICPVLLRTVIWIDNQCTETCSEEDCPIESFLDKERPNTQTNNDS